MVDTADRQKVYSVIDSRFDVFVRELSDYTRVPTISAQATKFQEGADATRKVLEAHGARVRLMPEEGGPPVVVGEIEEDSSLPWVILYNHYDVQPVDPLNEWETDPFDPVVKNGNLFGRGVSDTKGNTVAQAIAIQAIRDVAGRLPVNVRYFVDGEEESGSPHLLPFADAGTPPDPEMLRYLRKNTADQLRYNEIYGVSEVFGGKTRYQRLKRFMYGTTCTIDGIWSGYSGEGHKTVNPAVAHAKLDLRLLPGQRPDAIFDKLVAHLRNKGFGDVTVEKHSTFEPASSSIRERLPQAILAAVREVYGQEPLVYPWSAGSSTTWFFTRVGTPSPHGPGVGYDGSRAHAPNENIRLEDARRSMKATAATILSL